MVEREKGGTMAEVGVWTPFTCWEPIRHQNRILDIRHPVPKRDPCAGNRWHPEGLRRGARPEQRKNATCKNVSVGAGARRPLASVADGLLGVSQHGGIQTPTDTYFTSTYSCIT